MYVQAACRHARAEAGMRPRMPRRFASRARMRLVFPGRGCSSALRDTHPPARRGFGYSLDRGSLLVTAPQPDHAIHDQGRTLSDALHRVPPPVSASNRAGSGVASLAASSTLMTINNGRRPVEVQAARHLDADRASSHGPVRLNAATARGRPGLPGRSPDPKLTRTRHCGAGARHGHRSAPDQASPCPRSGSRT